MPRTCYAVIGCSGCLQTFSSLNSNTNISFLNYGFRTFLIFLTWIIDTSFPPSPTANVSFLLFFTSPTTWAFWWGVTLQQITEEACKPSSKNFAEASGSSKICARDFPSTITANSRSACLRSVELDRALSTEWKISSLESPRMARSCSWWSDRDQKYKI